MNKHALHFGRYDYAAFLTFFSYAGSSLAIPLMLVAIARDLGFPLNQGGMGAGGGLQIVRSVAMVAAMAGCGFLAGKIGKRRSLGGAVLLMGAGIASCAVAPGYFWLFPGLLVAGFAEGVVEGLATPFVQGLHQQEAGRYVNIAHSFWSVGTGFFVLLLGALLAYGVAWRLPATAAAWLQTLLTGLASWRVLLLLTGLLALIPALLLLFREPAGGRYPEVPQGVSGKTVWRQSVAIARSPRFWAFFGMMFLGGGAEFCLTFWIATYIQLELAGSVWAGGLGTAALALGMFCGRTGFGLLVREQQLPTLLLCVSLAGVPITGLILWITGNPVFSARYAILAIYGTMFLAGIAVAPLWPSLQVACVNRLPELDSTMVFVALSCAGIPGCGFFTWLMGYCADLWGLTRSFYLIPGALLVLALMIVLEMWIFPRKRRHCQKSRW